MSDFGTCVRCFENPAVYVKRLCTNCERVIETTARWCGDCVTQQDDWETLCSVCVGNTHTENHPHPFPVKTCCRTHFLAFTVPDVVLATLDDSDINIYDLTKLDDACDQPEGTPPRNQEDDVELFLGAY